MATALSTLVSALDQVVDAALDERRLVGGYVAMSRGGRLEYERAAGLADRESARSFSPDTIVLLASVTKPIVSTAALRLVDEGRLGLDDPVTRWLPDFRPTMADGDEATILVRHLLTHTSGLGYRFSQPADGPYAAADISDGLDLPGRTLVDNLSRIAAQPLFFAPGEQWKYSVATDVLGAVLEKVVGKPLPAIVEELVTSPLGLSDTGFQVTDRSRLAAAYVGDTPEPHLLAEGEIAPIPFMPDAVGVRFSPDRIFDASSFPSGGGGMAGTGPDAHLLLETIRLDAADGQQRLLTQESAQSLLQGQIGDIDTEPGKTFSFMGSVVQDPALAGTPQSAGTVGWGGVYGHSWFIDPSKGITSMLIANAVYEGMTGQLSVDVRDAIYAGIE